MIPSNTTHNFEYLCVLRQIYKLTKFCKLSLRKLRSRYIWNINHVYLRKVIKKTFQQWTEPFSFNDLNKARRFFAREFTTITKRNKKEVRDCPPPPTNFLHIHRARADEAGAGEGPRLAQHPLCQGDPGPEGDSRAGALGVDPGRSNV
jgi:hypothetical protein